MYLLTSLAPIGFFTRLKVCCVTLAPKPVSAEGGPRLKNVSRRRFVTAFPHRKAGAERPHLKAKPLALVSLSGADTGRHYSMPVYSISGG
jgi:hypothetical protein